MSDHSPVQPTPQAFSLQVDYDEFVLMYNELCDVLLTAANSRFVITSTS